MGYKWTGDGPKMFQRLNKIKPTCAYSMPRKMIGEGLNSDKNGAQANLKITAKDMKMGQKWAKNEPKIDQNWVKIGPKNQSKMN